MTDNEFQQLLQQAQGFASSYIHQAKEQRVYPDAEALADLRAFDIDIPDDGIPPEAMLEQLNSMGGPATVPTTGGRYFGFVNGGTPPPLHSQHAGWPTPGTKTQPSMSCHL